MMIIDVTIAMGGQVATWNGDVKEVGNLSVGRDPVITKVAQVDDGRSSVESKAMDFPGGAVVKNPPASAGDTGSIPGPGRSHMPRSN